jgi:hypothetical protein
VLGSLVLAACTRADDERSGPTALVAVEAPGTVTTVDERDQYALLLDLETALGDRIERDASAMAQVRSRWVGKRVRWEVGFVPVFCRSHDRCNVAPFDHGRRPDQRIRQGFMPELALDEAGFAAIQAACSPHTPCVLQLEATLGKFAFSPEEATSLRLDDVALVGARAARPDESWIVSRVQTRGRS